MARRSGLDPDRTLDFVAAVNELMTNAVRHGGGRGELRLWEDDRLRCEISDGGPGFPAGSYLDRAEPPEASASGGMGLWIVQRSCDELSIDSGPNGTRVRIGINLPAADRRARSAANAA